jgi:hypothetical protein
MDKAKEKSLCALCGLCGDEIKTIPEKIKCK